jgi:WXG100 family type VII secretion target
MAQVISAEEDALRKGADAVQLAKSNIQQQITKVRGEIEQLGGFWTGAAAASFTQLLNTWDTKARDLNNVLITLEQALRDTERDQAESEEAHKSTITGLGSMLAG